MKEEGERGRLPAVIDPTSGNNSDVRAALANAVRPFTTDDHTALALLSRIEKSFWRCALMNTSDADAAKQAYEEAVRTFIDPS